MAPETLRGTGGSNLRRDLVSFLCVILWAATFPKGDMNDDTKTGGEDSGRANGKASSNASTKKTEPTENAATSGDSGHLPPKPPILQWLNADATFEAIGSTKQIHLAPQISEEIFSSTYSPPSKSTTSSAICSKWPMPP